MPTKRIEHVALPFAGKRHTPDMGRLAGLYTGMGDALAANAIRKGENTQQSLMVLGKLFSNFNETRRQQQNLKDVAASRKAERDEARAFETEQARLEREARKAERTEAATTRKAEREEDAAIRAAEKAEAEVSDAIDKAPRGLVSQALWQAAQKFPNQAARFITQDGVAMNPMTGAEKQSFDRAKAEIEARKTDDSRLQAQFEESKRHNRVVEARTGATASALVPIVGEDGKTRYGTRAEARGGLVPSGQNKPATGLEKRALNFFNRAQQADVDLEKLEPEIAKMGILSQGRMELAPNFLQSQMGQSYLQAQRMFTEARLRKDSGAAIPPQEFDSDRRTYFAQPGDSPETLEQKRRGRAAILASLGFESGQALGEFMGDANEAQTLVQGYRQRAGSAFRPEVPAPAGAAPPPATGGGVRILSITPVPRP